MKLKSLLELQKKELKTREDAELYLEIALEDKDPASFLLALRDVVRIFGGGISKFSEKKKISRTSLYKTLSKKGNPELRTTMDILDSVGFKLTIERKKERRISL